MCLSETNHLTLVLIRSRPFLLEFCSLVPPVIWYVSAVVPELWALALWGAVETTQGSSQIHAKKLSLYYVHTLYCIIYKNCSPEGKPWPMASKKSPVENVWESLFLCVTKLSNMSLSIHFNSLERLLASPVTFWSAAGGDPWETSGCDIQNAASPECSCPRIFAEYPPYLFPPVIWRPVGLGEFFFAWAICYCVYLICWFSFYFSFLIVLTIRPI